MNDQEYLAQAGIDAETGAPASSNAGEATVSNNNITTATAEGASAPSPSSTSPTQKEVEMFEINGQRYPVTTEFQLTHGGKLLKVPYSKMANTFRQFEHLQEKWNTEYKPKISEFEKLRPEFDKYKSFYDQWGQLQDWSLQNPNDAKVLMELYQNRQQHLMKAQMSGQMTPEQAQQAQMNLDPLLQKIAQYEEKFGKYDQVLSKYEQAEKERQEAADVDAVKQDIHKFQAEYPGINLQEPDPDGVKLWAKIVTWGLQNGYNEFKPAAMMYLNDRVKAEIAAQARAEALKGVKTDHQNGIVKRSTQPLSSGQGSSSPTNQNIRKLSYGEIADMAKNQIRSFAN